MTPDELKHLISEADQGRPELTPEVVNLFGRSAPKVRRLLNALCSQPGANYLEIGVHTGSTLIPALYRNEACATAIDNWSFEDRRDELQANRDKFLPGRAINLIEQDCFRLDLALIPQGINVYFFDGDHSRDSQYLALMYYAPVLASQFVLLIDDYNWGEPQEETARALHDLGYRIVAEHVLPGTYNGDQTGWWNGLYVGLIEKP